jgi:hypothetical protein
MVAAPARSQAVCMPRLVILWTRPAHLSRVEADAWARAEVPGLAAAAGLDGTRVTEVRPAALEHPAAWHWMLELDLPDDDAAGRSLQRGPIADWVRDLRLLGMRPTVLLVDTPAP